jgi:RNA helicase
MIALKYSKTLYTVYEQDRVGEVLVYWVWGPPCSGKTYSVRKYLKENNFNYYEHSGDFTWWPNYDSHEVLFIDDFRDTKCSFPMLLSILSGENVTVEYKGGHRKLVSKQIFITSDRPPEEMYVVDYIPFPPSPKKQYKNNEDITQLTRRITRVIQLERPPDLQQMYEKAITNNFVSNAHQLQYLLCPTD